MKMAEAILKDKKRLLPAIAYLEGEYGYEDLFMGVPVVLGGGGIERIIELELTQEEKQALDRSAVSVRRVIDVVRSSGKTLQEVH